jgi:hypothetical protein
MSHGQYRDDVCLGTGKGVEIDLKVAVHDCKLPGDSGNAVGRPHLVYVVKMSGGMATNLPKSSANQWPKETEQQFSAKS